MGNCETSDRLIKNKELLIERHDHPNLEIKSYSASESPIYKNAYFTKLAYDIKDSNLSKNQHQSMNDSQSNMNDKLTPTCKSDYNGHETQPQAGNSLQTSTISKETEDKRTMNNQNTKHKQDLMDKLKNFRFNNGEHDNHKYEINIVNPDGEKKTIMDEGIRHTQKRRFITGDAQNAYSNVNMMDINTILSSDALNTTDPNFIIYEGLLLKYRPGTTFNWVERWCVITRTEFKYYKNKWSVGYWDIKPLHVTSIKDIVAIFRVLLDLPTNVNKSIELKSEKSTYKELYQIEIFTANSKYPYIDDKLDDDCVDIERLDDLDLNDYKGFQMWDKYLEQKKYIQPYRVSPNHLMRPPIKDHRESYKQLQIDSNRNSFGSRGSSAEPKNNTQDQKKNKDKIATSGFLSSHASPNSKSKSSMKQKNFDTVPKVTYHWIKNKANLTSWTGREREWYYSEKRLLFATSKIEEREKWLSVMNWITQKVAFEDSPDTTLRA